MSIKAVRSLLFNQLTWDLSHLGEGCVLLQAEHVSPENIRSSVHILKKVLGDALLDIVPSYDSITIFTGLSLERLSFLLGNNRVKANEKNFGEIQVEVPICYELGPDLKHIANQAGVSEEVAIEMHLGASYQVALVGFTPGFLYLSGLPEKLSCPRKESPRKIIEIGAVGIGGSQAGIYSLESPGGWNIIGRTPIQLFDQKKMPPMKLDVGTHLTFTRISKTEFEAWEN